MNDYLKIIASVIPPSFSSTDINEQQLNEKLREIQSFPVQILENPHIQKSILQLFVVRPNTLSALIALCEALILFSFTPSPPFPIYQSLISSTRESASIPFQINLLEILNSFSIPTKWLLLSTNVRSFSINLYIFINSNPSSSSSSSSSSSYFCFIPPTLRQDLESIFEMLSFFFRFFAK